jgi:hypothetical protein
MFKSFGSIFKTTAWGTSKQCSLHVYIAHLVIHKFCKGPSISFKWFNGFSEYSIPFIRSYIKLCHTVVAKLPLKIVLAQMSKKSGNNSMGDRMRNDCEGLHIHHLHYAANHLEL